MDPESRRPAPRRRGMPDVLDVASPTNSAATVPGEWLVVRSGLIFFTLCARHAGCPAVSAVRVDCFPWDLCVKISVCRCCPCLVCA